MKWTAIAAVIGLAVVGGVAFALWASGGTTAADGCNTTLKSLAPKFEYDIQVVDTTGCDKNDWIVINSGGGNEECKRVDAVDFPEWLVFYGVLANDHSAGETVVEVPYCPTPEQDACDDGIDNDLDGAVDCEDPDCDGDPVCEAPPEDCDDGIDNDEDGAVDCEDPDCYADPVCEPIGEDACDDGIDNDEDGAVDCDDPDCAGNPACEPPPGSWECGTYGALEPWPDAEVILNPDSGPPGTAFDVELTNILPNEAAEQPVEVLWAWDAQEQGGWVIGTGAVPQHETSTVVQATVPGGAQPPADVVAVCWWHSVDETWYYQSASFQVGEGTPTPTPGESECGTYGALEPWPHAEVILFPDWGPPGTAFDLAVWNIPANDAEQPLEVLFGWDAEEQGRWLIGTGTVPQHETSAVVGATVPQDAPSGEALVTACWWRSLDETWYYQSAPFRVGEEALPEETPEPTAAPTAAAEPPPAVGQMCNCPEAGSWSLATWQGAPINDANGALATCGEGAVDVAYALDSSGQWLRWFRDRPEISNLSELPDTQGLIVLGAQGTLPIPLPEPACIVDPDMVPEGVLRACPPPGGWSLAVWQGPDGIDAGEALSTCPEWGNVKPEVAYSLGPDNQTWERWFDGRPEISNMATLNSLQGIITLGGPGPPPPMVEPDFGPLLDWDGQPAAKAPSNLKAWNGSVNWPPPAYIINLAWDDNSGEQDGFRIYAEYVPDPANYEGSPSLEISVVVIDVDRDQNWYYHHLNAPADPDDKYCYWVSAYKEAPLSVLGRKPVRKYSEPSNVACSYYHYSQPSQKECAKDDDDDFVCDSGPQKDQCVGIKGVPPHGCPDQDNDGVPDKDEKVFQDGTSCAGLKASAYSENDKGPKVPADKPGCPMSYQLRFMGMRTVNNTLNAMPPYPDSMVAGGFVNGESATDEWYTKDFPDTCKWVTYDHINRIDIWPYYGPEEPYLTFLWTNGLLQKQIARHGEAEWCCGDKVLVSRPWRPTVFGGGHYEPDGDQCGEKDMSAFKDLKEKKIGQLVWPKADYVWVDPRVGFSLTVSLFERDWEREFTVWVAKEKDIDDYFSVAKGFYNSAKRCITGFYTWGCWESILNTLGNFIQTLFFTEKEAFTAIDQDDYYGSGGWGIMPDEALSLTKDDGAYGFLMQLPAKVHLSPGGWCTYEWCRKWAFSPKPKKFKTDPPYELGAIGFFCLVREGVPDNEVWERCAKPFYQGVKPIVPE